MNYNVKILFILIHMAWIKTSEVPLGQPGLVEPSDGMNEVSGVYNSSITLSWNITAGVNKTILSVVIYSDDEVIVGGLAGGVTLKGKELFNNKLEYAHYVDKDKTNGYANLILHEVKYEYTDKKFKIKVVFDDRYKGVSSAESIIKIKEVKGIQKICGIVPDVVNLTESAVKQYTIDFCGNPKPVVSWKLGEIKHGIAEGILLNQSERKYRYTFSIPRLDRNDCDNQIKVVSKGFGETIERMIDINFKMSEKPMIPSTRGENCPSVQWNVKPSGKCKLRHFIKVDELLPRDITSSTGISICSIKNGTTKFQMWTEYNGAVVDRSEVISIKKKDASRSSDKTMIIIVAVVVGCILLIVIVIVTTWLVIRRKSKANRNSRENENVRRAAPQQNEYASSADLQQERNKLPPTIYSDVGPGGGRFSGRPAHYTGPLESDYSQVRVNNEGYPAHPDGHVVQRNTDN